MTWYRTTNPACNARRTTDRNWRVHSRRFLECVDLVDQIQETGRLWDYLCRVAQAHGSHLIRRGPVAAAALILIAFVAFGCGPPPLYRAIATGDENKAITMIDNGVDLKPWNDVPPLHVAAAFGRTGVMVALIDRGADIDGSTTDGITPLHAAAAKDQSEAALLLLQRGAAIDKPDSDGATPLYIAALQGSDNVARLLLAKGADPNARSLKQFTPLHPAAEKRHATTVSALLEYGADVHSKSEFGATPLNQAFWTEEWPDETTAALVRAGAKCNEIDGRPKINARTFYACATFHENNGNFTEAAHLYEAAAEWFEAAAAQIDAQRNTSRYERVGPGEILRDALMQQAFANRDGAMYGTLYATQLEQRRQVDLSMQSHMEAALQRSHATQCRKKAEELRTQ